MKLRWTSKALSDMERLHEFLSAVDPQAATNTVRSLVAAPAKLLAHPRIGEKLDEFSPREVRRILIGQYEMRYEIRESELYVLRLWHTREQR